jgi:hypothetical protein
MATGKLKLDEVLFVCDQVRGNVSRAAERLAVTRWALQKFLKRHPRAREAFTQWRQKLVDEAETALWDCVAERQPWAIALVLKTLGKWRGYIEAQHLTPTGQTRLPQGEDGQTDEPWLDALRLPKRPWDDDDAPEPDPEPLVDWEARETELIQHYETRLADAASREAALIARYEPLLRAEAPEPEPTDLAEVATDGDHLVSAAPESELDDDPVDAELAEVVHALKRRLGL